VEVRYLYIEKQQISELPGENNDPIYCYPDGMPVNTAARPGGGYHEAYQLLATDA
jgi:hypothetical protein